MLSTPHKNWTSRKKTIIADSSSAMPMQNTSTHSRLNGRSRNDFDSRWPVSSRTAANGMRARTKFTKEDSTLDTGKIYLGM